MTAFPLVWLVSVLTTIAAWALAQNTRAPFAARLFLCAFLLALGVIGLLLGFRLSWEAAWAARVQPLIAVVVAPAAYLGFRALTQDRTASLRTALLWNGVPVVLAQLVILARVAISADVLVLAINGIYLFRIATLLRLGADDFAQVPPQSMSLVRAALYATTFLIAMMVATDLLIVAAGLFAGDATILRLLTGVSGIFTAFVVVVALVGAPMAMAGSGPAPSRTEEPSGRDRELMAALDTVLNEKRLYTDSNLTLARVARRLSVSAREVSQAINRVTGENFSRYINGFRIRHAQRALRESDLPITEVMFDAGFVSKSSFNTEFRRITGQTPSQFRANGPDT